MLYAQAGIKEYWVVDIASQAVHQLRQPTVDGYQNIRKFARHEISAPSVSRTLHCRLLSCSTKNDDCPGRMPIM